MEMSGKMKKRSYLAPQIRTQGPQTQSVLLACSDPLSSFDCSGLVGYQCCAPSEDRCSEC
jgi:hypothetical protein